ncbi:MAG: ABC transporter ATP-binding protein [Actinomycetota bacterium]
MSIEVRGLRRSYRTGSVEVPALRGLDLDLPAGSVTALYGASGSGKTTLLNCVAGLDTPDAGTVVVDGTEVTALSSEQAVAWRRGALGFVHQGHALMPWLTARENVEVPLRLTGTPRRDRAHIAAEALDEVGLHDWVDHLPDELSGGQRQRVAIARAAATRPAVVLADEPTGALDERTGARILELLAGLAADRDCTVVMATHDPATATVADRVVELRDGRLRDRPATGTSSGTGGP